MGVSLYNIRKWTRMLTGKSIMHVNQGLGQHFSKDEVSGYYNDMTEKVTRLLQVLEDEAALPPYKLPSGQEILFPVDIFQYGLGAYDMWLRTHDERYCKKFLRCCEWTLENQESNGAWNTFFFRHPSHPYGAMAQGEACSLLLRGYLMTSKEEYKEAAQRGIDFMLTPLVDGGTSVYDGGGLMLMEYTHLPAVLNGWIFAWWGLFDWVKLTQDDNRYKTLLWQCEESLRNALPRYATRYWSQYDLGGKMASPFYHKLHIAQMQAMFQLTGHDEYRQIAERWEHNRNSRWCKYCAIVKKAWQKVREKEEWAKQANQQ